MLNDHPATRGSNRRRRLALVPAVVAAVTLMLSLTPSVSAQETEVQTAISTEGGYAWTWGGGLEEDELGDGRLVDFQAFFSFPEGVVTGTDPSEAVDLREPVGVLELTAYTPAPAPYTPRETWDLCTSATNVTSYDTGHRISTPNDYGDDFAQYGWTGVWFDIECDAGLGFDFFRVHFDSAAPAQRFDPTAAGAEVDLTKDYGKPAFLGIDPIVAPGADVDTGGGPTNDFRRHQWGGPDGIGTLTAEPRTRTTGGATVCGHRGGDAVQCWGTAAATDIVIDTWGMTHTYTPWVMQ